MSIIAGLGGSIHDFATCLIKDNQIVAVEDERLTRIRYAINSQEPCEPSLQYCLDYLGIDFDDIDTIVGNDELLQSIHPNKFSNAVFINHHLSHAYSTFFTSPFEEAAILVVDGAGSKTLGDKFESRETTTYAWGSKNNIETITRVTGNLRGHNALTKQETLTSNSIGEFYRAVANAIGFGWLVGPGKIMGLAPYGAVINDDRFIPEMQSCIDLLPNGKFRINVNGKKGIIEKLYQIRQKHNNEEFFTLAAAIAHAGQTVLEQLLLHALEDLWEKTNIPNLCLAGGVALNSLANSKIPARTKFKNIHVFFAPGDSGTAIGAAIWGAITKEHSISELIRYPIIPFLGKQYSNQEMISALQNAHLNYTKPPNIELEVAQLLNAGLTAAWYQASSEFGPRSLGNRSILADPRNSSIRDHINHNIKGREWFRPLAPVVIDSVAQKYFENLCPSPWMQFVWPVRNEYRDLLPAITHVDGSARIQSLSRYDNERFYSLLEQFKKLTDIPILLNTSLNIKGEPIVETPYEAVWTFVNSKIDVLVLGDYLVVKDKPLSL